MIYCGIDIGSQVHQAFVIDENKTPLCKSFRFEESADGHLDFVNKLGGLSKDEHFVIAFESTGVYYQNLINSISRGIPNATFYRLNPYAVSHYAKSSMRRQCDDKISAEIIARMINEKENELYSYEFEPNSDISIISSEMIELKKQLTADVNRLHKEIFVANPEIREVFGNIDCDQCLVLLDYFPTASHLAKASLKKVSNLKNGTPYSHRIGENNAEVLINNAKRSIASDTTPTRANRIKRLIEKIRLTKRHLEICEKELLKNAGDYPFQQKVGEKLPTPKNPLEKRQQDIFLIDSIAGIGKWGAIVFVAFAGDISRFQTPEKLNAFVGTCAAYQRSGNNTQSTGTISKKGNKKLRWLVYMLVITGITKNPILMQYYNKQISTGKKKIQAIAACMTKLIRLIWGVVKTRTIFDPDYHIKYLTQKGNNLINPDEVLQKLDEDI